jgi:hypothetical protein
MCIKSFLRLSVRGNEGLAVLDSTFLQPDFFGGFLEVFSLQGCG